jgi:hypothetical protein
LLLTRKYAVLDEWNSDKYILEIKVNRGEVRGMGGRTASQLNDAKRSKPGHRQMLEGNGQQVYVGFKGEMGELQNALQKDPRVVKYYDEVTRRAAEIPPTIHDKSESFIFIHTVNGKEIELQVSMRLTGWKDANGVHGWESPKGPGVSALVRRTMSQIETEPKSQAEDETEPR